MPTMITPDILRRIASDKFQGKIEDKKAIFKKIGAHGINHLQMKKELEKMGYDTKKRDVLLRTMCNLAEEKMKRNIKMARRLSGRFDLDNREDFSSDNIKKKFAGQLAEGDSQSSALQKSKKEILTSVKNRDQNSLNASARTSALSLGSKKTGFAGKLEEKKTGFANQSGI